ncbi:hypothetical protein MED121_12815 [Marinomonas sp. MED121]|uniref:GNAT family N-acetyltransferase n=1 Tax=Marinomonas sp. MED121 TaxID=314277 RepID=UPI000068FFAA|nr:GNAT family N-acetyltransferase [Marinomonas sp. MED121]EAQ66809.1 hypothetical protein MED121_12815 [Marinomonas sp. MED121]
MEIKEYQAHQEVELAKLYVSARVDAFFWVDAQNFKASDFSKDTQGERLWVAQDQGEILGFIGVWQADHFIHHLYVDQKHYRKGVGKALINKVKSHYQAPLRLKCLVKNDRAIRFYLDHGFQVLSEGLDGFGAYFLMQSNCD